MTSTTLGRETTLPLVNALHLADEVEIREVVPQNRIRILSSLDRYLAHGNSEEKAYLVHLRTQKEPSTLQGASTDRDSIIKNAAILIQNEDFLLARTLYSFLLKQNIKDGDALRGLGIALHGLSEPESARKCFIALWDLYHPVDCLYWLGVTFLKESNEKTALAYFDRIDAPENLEASLRFRYFKDRGTCLARLGQFDRAVESYQSALHLAPQSSHIFANLGTVELQRGALESSKSYFEKAIEFDPRNSRAYCGLGVLAFSKGQNQEAERYFVKTLELDDNHRMALIQLVEVAYRIRSFSKALEILSTYLSAHPSDDEMHFQLASILVETGSREAAAEALKQVFKHNPHHERAIRLGLKLRSKSQGDQNGPNPS